MIAVAVVWWLLKVLFVVRGGNEDCGVRGSSELEPSRYLAACSEIVLLDGLDDSNEICAEDEREFVVCG